MDETNLIHLNSLFLLQRLLDSQHFVFWFKVEGLLSAGQGLDKNLTVGEQLNPHQVSGKK